MTHYEFTLTVEGDTLVVVIRWYASAVQADPPIHTDTFRYALTDPAVTPEMIRQQVMDRGRIIQGAVATWVAINDAFGGLQNTRLPFA